MTSIADAPENPLPVGRSRSRRGRGGAIGWLRANLFSSIPSTVISLLLIFLLAKACVSLLQWGFWNAIWARSSLSMLTPSGMNNGNMTLAMNNRLISGTPRMSST